MESILKPILEMSFDIYEPGTTLSPMGVGRSASLYLFYTLLYCITYSKGRNITASTELLALNQWMQGIFLIFQIQI